ncbi:MAG TPA: hypothetical protein PKY01_04795 [Candidatus Hydrogenedentes bacterium]|nr:hypothetical protein [Candidatus Hydrogenedentota bacterium]
MILIGFASLPGVSWMRRAARMLEHEGGFMNPASIARMCATFAVLGLLGAAAPADEAEDVLNRQREFNAVQIVYRNGTPHTDRQGRLLTTFEPGKSFFQVGIWGAPLPGRYYDSECDWAVLREAGFNTVWPWAADPATALQAGASFDMQIVPMGEIPDDKLAAIKEHPNLLGNVWMDEPIGGLGSKDMDELFGKFAAYRDQAHTIAPGMPVFVNDAPWIMPPATTWWLKWNSAGDVSCHDNYPVMNRTGRAASIGAEPNGIPQTVALAVADAKEQKPVWLIVGAFDQPGAYGQAFPFRFPTPEQLRACVYAGIIHGATGIIYFIWDNYVPRDGAVIGMAPNPLPHYTPNPKKEGFPNPTPATPLQLVNARALWETATQINREIAELTPAILSPTVGADTPYTLKIEGKAPTATPIRTLLKRGPEGEYILLTVNVDDAVLKVAYEFPRPLAKAEVLFENRLPETLPDDAATFELSYEPFTVHVVRIVTD